MGAIGDILERFGNNRVKLIQQNLASTGTDASGETSRSVKSESTENRVIVSGKDFIYVVETGRGPTKKGNQGKPTLQSQILKWINTGKPGINEKIESASWAISKFIHKHGTQLFRSGGRTDILTPVVNDEKAYNQLTKEIADVSFKKVLKVIDDGIADNNS